MNFVLGFILGLFSSVNIYILARFLFSKHLNKKNSDGDLEKSIDISNKEKVANDGKLNRLDHLLKRRESELTVLKTEWAEQSSLKKYVEFFNSKENEAEKDKKGNEDLLSQIAFELDKYTSPESIQVDISALERKIIKLQDFIENLKIWIKQEEKL